MMSTGIDTPSAMEAIGAEHDQQRLERERLQKMLEEQQKETDRLRSQLAASSISEVKRRKSKSEIDMRDVQTALVRDLKSPIKSPTSPLKSPTKLLPREQRRASEPNQEAVKNASKATKSKTKKPIDKRESKSEVDPRDIKKAIERDLKSDPVAKKKRTRSRSDINLQEVRAALDNRKDKRPHPFIGKDKLQLQKSPRGAKVARSLPKTGPRPSTTPTKLDSPLSPVERGKRSLNHFPTRAHPLEKVPGSKKIVSPKTPSAKSPAPRTIPVKTPSPRPSKSPSAKGALKTTKKRVMPKTPERAERVSPRKVRQPSPEIISVTISPSPEPEDETRVEPTEQPDSMTTESLLDIVTVDQSNHVEDGVDPSTHQFFDWKGVAALDDDDDDNNIDSKDAIASTVHVQRTGVPMAGPIEAWEQTIAEEDEEEYNELDKDLAVEA